MIAIGISGSKPESRGRNSNFSATSIVSARRVASWIRACETSSMALSAGSEIALESRSFKWNRRSTSVATSRRGLSCRQVSSAVVMNPITIAPKTHE